MVYLYHIAVGIDNYVNSNNFGLDFKDDFRSKHLKYALNNVGLIGANLKTRLQAVRGYLQKIGVVDPSFNPEQKNFTNNQSKVLAIVTAPPSSGGAGNATIQTISKFGFIYSDLGLKQPLPVDAQNKPLSLDFTQPNGVKYAGQNNKLPEDKRGTELFNIDDNGWW